MADQVLYSGVACITDLMVKEGLINLDFADVRAVMREMGKAMMGTGEASGEKRALTAAEAAIANPLIDDSSMKGAKGLLISITGGKDLTLFEVDEAATRIREEVDQDANIIVGATFDESARRHHPRLGRGHRHRAGADRRNSRRRLPAPRPAAAVASDRPAGKPPGRPDRAAARRQPAPCRARRQKLESRSRAAMPAAPAAAPQRPAASVERAALAAIAAAVAPEAPAAGRAGPAGLLRRRHGSPDAAQKPSLFPDLTRSHGPRSMSRWRRKPSFRRRPNVRRSARRGCRKFEELPMPAQTEIRQARGEVEEEHPQKSRMSLLQRLANVGLGRRDEETEPPIAARASGPAMRRCRRCRTASRSARCSSRSRRTIRYRNMPAGPRRKVSTPMAAPHLLRAATGRRPS